MSNSGIKIQINKSDCEYLAFKYCNVFKYYTEKMQIHLKNGFFEIAKWILISGSLLLNVITIYVQFSKVAIGRCT